MRTVTGHVAPSGWPYEYRAHVVRHDGRFRKGWRYIVEEKWVHWRHYTTSGVYKTEAEAVAAANAWLDHKDGYAVEKSFV